MPLPSGSRLGPYEILALVGAGGMGEVYRARDTRLDRLVAVKILPAHVEGAPGFRERFEREARAISAVEHPHICALYDVGADGGVSYLVMQYVDGETLGDRIAQGPVPIDEALALARQIAAGLEAAHERGIVHRDLKPSNIKLTSDSQVKLLDFGLARVLTAVAVDPAVSPTFTAGPTQAGLIVGSAAYMSPEQARGKTVDKRADVWAFGCVLYEMLAGRRAFDGETITDVLAAVVGRDPDWTALPANTPPGVRRLLHRCLQKDVARRLRDVGDARLELEEAADVESAGTAPENAGARSSTTRTTLKGRATAIAWIVAAAALTVAAYALLTRSAPAASRPMHFSAVTNFAGVEAQPSLSPDGRSVAFVSNRDGQWDVYVGLVTGGSLIRITNDPNLEIRPRWSPDGARLLFARLNESGLYDTWVVPALGGAARRMLLNALHPTWSPDGQSIAYSSGGGLWISDAAGANPRAVARPEAGLGYFQPAFSHDGRSIAAVARRRAGVTGPGPYGELIVVDVASGAASQLTRDGALALSPAWSPDGRSIYFASSRGGTLNVWKMPAASGEPEQITAGQGDDADIDLAADGRRLIFSSYRVNVNLADIDIEAGSSGRPKWLTTDAARGESAPRYSPDGRRIAYFSNRKGAERESLWVIEADGRNATRIVEDGRVNIFPRWTSAGDELLFLSRLPGSLTGEVSRVSLDGGAPRTLSIKPWSPSWGDVAPDGRLIYRTSAQSGELRDLRTKQIQPIADLLGDPLWSRDGRTFAYAVTPDADAPDALGVWTAPPGGARRHIFRGWVMSFVWTGAGDILVVEGKPDLKGVLWRVDAEGRKTVVLSRLPLCVTQTNVPYSRFDVHPDGRRIVIEALEFLESDIGVIDNVR